MLVVVTAAVGLFVIELVLVLVLAWFRQMETAIRGLAGGDEGAFFASTSS